VPPLSKRELAPLATRYPGQLRLTTTVATNDFFLNTRVPPFDDVRARLAVNYALDRTCQILPPNYPSYRRACLYLP
jgi:peptide/nickel transport system substrate-binding protein